MSEQPGTALSRPARVGYPDLIRIVAILMVVMIHTIAPLFNTLDLHSTDFVICTVLDCLTHAGVPLFVMVSGIFLLDEKREVTIRRAVRHYALPLAGLYLFWSLAYAIVNKVAMPLAFEGATLSAAMIREFIQAVIEGAYHMWYIPMMIGLYLITPLLRRFVRADCLPLVRWFLLLSVIFQGALPLVLSLLKEFAGWDFAAFYANFHLEFLLGYPAYYVAGWYLANHAPRRRAVVYAAGVAGLLLMIGLTVGVSYHSGEAIAAHFEALSLGCAAYAVAVFCLFAWEGEGIRSTALLTGLSRLTFGVYMIHVEVQSLFKLFLPYTGGTVGYVLLQWAVVTVVSFAAAFVLSRIPLLRRTVRA